MTDMADSARESPSTTPQAAPDDSLLITRKQAKALRQQNKYWETRARRSEAERQEARTRAQDSLNQRNRMAAYLAFLFPGSHMVEADPTHYPDDRRDARREIIRKTVCIHFPDYPGKNATFHVNPDEEELFAGLPYLPNDWDGHTTAEKFAFIDKIGKAAMAQSTSELPQPSM